MKRPTRRTHGPEPNERTVRLPFRDVRAYVTVKNSCTAPRQPWYIARRRVSPFAIQRRSTWARTAFDNETVLRRDSWTLLVRGERQDVTYCHTRRRELKADAIARCFDPLLGD